MGTTASNVKTSVLRIACADDTTAGTGFVVAEQLAVTCAHVVIDAGGTVGQSIQIQFFGASNTCEALVLSMGWSPVKEDDVAFLQLPPLPAAVAPVVLGFAEQCSGHGYTAFGCAPSGRSPTRPATGTLHDVVEVEDVGCHPLLQLDGNLVEKGLSGSPVFDVVTRRVVGMVNSYENATYVRVAWATTTETLAVLFQEQGPLAFSLWPDTYGPDERQDYLERVVDTNATLRLPLAYKDVPLERLYISLRADEMNREERLAERLSLDPIIERGQAADENTDRYMRHARMLKQVMHTPTMFMLEARNWPRLFGKRETGPINVAQLVQRHAQVVVLGDPGSGKTTVGKWLALQHAHSALRGWPSVAVAADQVRPGSQKQQPLDLGRTRLPIFLSMATLSTLDTTHLLDTILEYNCPSGKPPVKLASAFQALRRDALFRGEALIVLDGLDEVQNPLDRREIMLDISRFLYEPPPEATAHWQENQVLLTSRIVGYQYAPLIDLPHYTVEGMDEQAITAFCQAWMRQIAEGNAHEIEQLAHCLRDAIFDHAHPGVRLLAANPLLLTILAQVYWEQPEHGLPATRVALFQQATKALFRQRKTFWDQARITEEQLEQALGQVAFDIQTETALGLVVGGTVRASLGEVLRDQIQVEAVLEVAREITGFLVQKGEGIYGFLHRSLQEYFVALYFTARPDEMIARMQPYIWNPNWREPLILAASIVSNSGHAGYSRLSEVLQLFLDTLDPLVGMLPRGALLIAAASTECEYIPDDIGKRAAEQLLLLYAEREGRSKSPILRNRIRQAFLSLQRGSAKQIVERLLCSFIQSEQFEHRYAAIDLVILQWESSALVNALLTSLHNYATPSGSLLTALFTIWQRQPALFQHAFLPMRQVMQREPYLWDLVKNSPVWQDIIQVLYLPPGADFSPDSIYRDSPLTARIEAILHQNADSNSDEFVQFQQEMRSLTLRLGTPEARDAALILITLGDTSWINACLTQAAEQPTGILSIAAALTFVYVLGRIYTFDFVRNCTIDLAFYLDIDNAMHRHILHHEHHHFSDADIYHAFARSFDLNRTVERLHRTAIEHNNSIAVNCNYDRTIDPDRNLSIERFSYLSSTINLTRTINYDLTCAFDLGFAIFRTIYNKRPVAFEFAYEFELARSFSQDLRLAIELDHEISKSIQLARPRWIDDEKITQRLDKTLACLQEAERVLLFNRRGYVLLGQFLLACKEQWHPPQQQEQVENAPSVPTTITIETLPTLIAHLTSTDDALREQAREVLHTQEDASTLGQDVIEQMAQQSLIHAGEPLVGIQLKLALQQIIHDEPAWVRSWVKQLQAGQEQRHNVAERILSNLHHVTEQTFEVLLDIVPHASNQINAVLLRSLSWQLRLQDISNGWHDRLQSHLLSWLEQEKQPETRAVIMETLGHCQDAQRAASTADALLKRVEDKMSNEETTSLYIALARLASQEITTAGQIRERLKNRSAQPSAAAALTRLDTVLAWKWKTQRSEISIHLLNQLTSLLPDATSCLMALLDAGTDDDVWDDGYHGVLVQAAQQYIDRAHASNLLAIPLQNLQQAANNHDWPARRIMLATLAACAETLPKTLLLAAQNYLSPEVTLEILLVQGAMDTESFDVRRFALRAISYLGTVTAGIVPALLAACQEIKTIQRDAIDAASRFKEVEGDLLTPLLDTLEAMFQDEHSRITDIYALIKLLVALGSSTVRSASEQRTRIAASLVEALKHPRSQRAVFYTHKEPDLLFLEEIEVQNKGSLADELYTALLEITEGFI